MQLLTLHDYYRILLSPIQPPSLPIISTSPSHFPRHSSLTRFLISSFLRPHPVRHPSLYPAYQPLPSHYLLPPNNLSLISIPPSLSQPVSQSVSHPSVCHSHYSLLHPSLHTPLVTLLHPTYLQLRFTLSSFA